MFAARSSLRPILSYKRQCVPWNPNRSNFRRPAVRYFSSNNKQQQEGWTSSSYRWRLFARIVRYIRIPVLVAGVYSLGYQQGIIEYARNPAELRESLLESVLAGVGCTDRNQVDSLSDDEIVFVQTSNRQMKKVARIGNQIMQAALVLAKEKQKEAAEAVKSQLPMDISNEQWMQVLHSDETYVMWTNAIQQLEGSWTYMLVDTELPNAFVTEILPRHIFVTTAMMKVIQNDDELALVLGHELSHMILGHITDKILLDTILRTIEVLLLSMDPTTGVLSLAVVGSLATLRTAFSAAHSRENEHEADELGIQLAAMACFHTRRAAHVFEKLHALSGAPQSGKRLLSFADTHPPSSDRYERLVVASATENVGKYADTTCASVGSRLRSALSAAAASSSDR